MRRIEPTPSRTEQAYKAILDDICAGVLAPGTHLVQEQIAERLGVSRQPIQQAMALLKSDGVVQEMGSRGLYVTPVEVGAMRQHYEIRAALDELAARLAADRARSSPGIAQQIQSRGDAIMQAGMSAVGSSDVGRMVQHDVEFHTFLYQNSGNPLLVGTAEPHWRYLRRVMAEVLRFAEPGPSIWQQHRDILHAVVAGEPDTAAKLAKFHVHGAAARLAKAFTSGQTGQ